MDMKKITWDILEKVKNKSPLIHNITNFVVMNSSANILLAAGASPVMAHCQAEVEEMVSFAGALVLNIGTIQEDWLESMICAARKANSLNIPIILDPVGAGATKLRTDAVKKIMDECSITVLRGNCSEVFSLGSAEIKTRGVDSSLTLSDCMIDSASQMAVEMNCIIAITGPEDCITDGKQVFRVKNGHPIFTKVTGTGCGLTAVTGAFCAVTEDDYTRAVAAALGYYSLCGELAAKISTNPGSFNVAFIDYLYTLGKKEIDMYLEIDQER